MRREERRNKMDEIKYREYVKLLNDNKELRKKIYKELIKKGIDHNLKGFYYLLDIGYNL